MGLRRKNKQNQSRKQKRKTNRQNKRQKRNLKTNKKQTRKNKTKKRVKKLRGGAGLSNEKPTVEQLTAKLRDAQTEYDKDENVFTIAQLNFAKADLEHLKAVIAWEEYATLNKDEKNEADGLSLKTQVADTLKEAEKFFAELRAVGMDENTFNNHHANGIVPATAAAEEMDNVWTHYIHSDKPIPIIRYFMQRYEATFQKKMYESKEYIYAAVILGRHFLGEHKAIMKLLPVNQKTKTRMDDCPFVEKIKAVVKGSGLISYDPHDDESRGYKNHMVNRFASIVSEMLYEAIYYRFQDGRHVNRLYTFDSIMRQIEVTLSQAIKQLNEEDEDARHGGQQQIIVGNKEITLFTLKNILFLYINNKVLAANIKSLIGLPPGVKEFYSERQKERKQKREEIFDQFRKWGIRKLKQFINNPLSVSISFGIGTPLALIKNMALQNLVLKKGANNKLATAKKIATKMTTQILGHVLNAPLRYLHDSLKTQMGIWAHIPILAYLAYPVDGAITGDEGLIETKCKEIQLTMNSTINTLMLSPGKRVAVRTEHKQIVKTQSALDAECIALVDGGLEEKIDRLEGIYGVIKNIGPQDERVNKNNMVTSSQPPLNMEGLPTNPVQPLSDSQP